MHQATTTEGHQAIPEQMEQPRTEEQQAPTPPAATHPQQPQASHPAQAPYQPYPYHQQSFATQYPAVPFNKTWHWIKIALASTSIICCVIVLALSITQSTYAWYTSLTSSAFWGALAIVAGLWDIAELITVFACGKRHNQDTRQGIHPGAHVGVDLILWLAGVFGTFIAALLYMDIQWARRRCQYYLDADSDLSYNSYYCDNDEYAALKSGVYVSMVTVIMVFVSILTLVHFIIFVRACVETNQRNRLRRTVMMVPPMYYGPPPGVGPYGNYTMALQQGPMTPNQGAVPNEKAAAAAVPPQNNHSNLAGFYAPAVLPPAVRS